MLRKLDIAGNPYVGVLCATSEDRAVVGSDVPPKAIRALEETLAARVARTTIGGANVVGSLIAMNSRGAVVTGFATPNELESLKGLEVFLLPHRLNAAGNNILCNDSGAIVHPGYDDRTIRAIGETLAVDAIRGTLAGLRTVGSVGVATNKGVLAHPHADQTELATLREVLKVPTTITTANYGTAQIGACLVANSKGAVVGGRTTPIELGRIEDGLGYF